MEAKKEQNPLAKFFDKNGKLKSGISMLEYIKARNQARAAANKR